MTKQKTVGEYTARKKETLLKGIGDIDSNTHTHYVEARFLEVKLGKSTMLWTGRGQEKEATVSIMSFG